MMNGIWDRSLWTNLRSRTFGLIVKAGLLDQEPVVDADRARDVVGRFDCSLQYGFASEQDSHRSILLFELRDAGP